VVVFWVVGITLLVGFTTSSNSQHPITETRSFCAYGRVFVEFEDNGRIWGTLMLDFYGKPIRCREGDEPEINNTI
jgi:hypothetical protein